MDTSDTPVFTAVADTHVVLKAIGKREQIVATLTDLKNIKTLKQLAAYTAQLEQQLTDPRSTK